MIKDILLKIKLQTDQMNVNIQNDIRIIIIICWNFEKDNPV